METSDKVKPVSGLFLVVKYNSLGRFVRVSQSHFRRKKLILDPPVI